MTRNTTITWRQGATLDVTIPTAADLTGRDLLLIVRRTKPAEELMIQLESGGPAEARLTAIEGGVRVQLGAAEGATVQTGGRDQSWVYGLKATASADPEDVLMLAAGAWDVIADPARTGEQISPTPAGDTRYLRCDVPQTLTEEQQEALQAALGIEAGGVGPPGPAGPSNRITESSGPTDLTVGPVADGEYLRRVGNTVVGATPAGGGASNVIWVGAGEWIPRVTAGAGIDGEEFATNRQNLDYLAFDAGVAEFAQVWLAWPGAFSTFTATFYWTSASGSGSVVWQARARGYVDDDAIDQAFGTAQSVTDTLLSANDVHQSAATAAVTPAGTVSAGRLVCFGIGRDATNGSDTLAVDARLIGVRLEFDA